jgi:hypothetical protein
MSAIAAEIRDCKGVLVATFIDREEAVLALPALARVLRRTLRISYDATEQGLLSTPLPRGCFLETSRFTWHKAGHVVARF